MINRAYINYLQGDIDIEKFKNVTTEYIKRLGLLSLIHDDWDYLRVAHDVYTSFGNIMSGLPLGHTITGINNVTLPESQRIFEYSIFVRFYDL